MILIIIKWGIPFQDLVLIWAFGFPSKKKKSFQ